MKVLQVCNHFYPHKGGIEQITFYLSRELIKRKYRVKVICADEPSVGDLIIDNIEVNRLPYIFKISNTNITISLGCELLKESCDVIHTHLPYPWNATISTLISLVKNKPLFLTYHNDIVGSGINKAIATCYNLTALRPLLKRSNKIFITHGLYLKTSPFIKLFSDKVIVTPPGVDLEKFKPLDLPRSEDYIIFFLSILDHLHLYKGLEYLLLSIKGFTERIPLKLYVGGTGDLLNYYKEFVKKNELEKVVIFLGFLNDEDLVKYYNLCDVFVLPSISSSQEGFGLVVLEAMACKKPVIVTDIMGVADDVKRENAGIVVKPKSIDELSEAIKFILLNEKERQSMEENAYGLVKEKYTWQNHANIVEREYLKALK